MRRALEGILLAAAVILVPTAIHRGTRNVAVEAADAVWRAVISPAGSVRLERRGKDIGSLDPGLYETGWKSASLAPAQPGTQPTPGALKGQIRAPGGAVVDTEIRCQPAGQTLRLTYRLTPQQTVGLNSLHVGMAVPSSLLTGGSFAVDGAAQPFPSEFRSVALHSAPVRTLDIRFADGSALTFRFAAATPVLVQDDRQWGPTFTIRIGPQMDGAPWPAGKSLDLAFSLSAAGGFTMEQDGPVTIEAGAEWLPLDAELDIEPDSAVDFSHLTPWHAPAGKLGRVLAHGPHFAFEQNPAEAVRFYGVNLCFGAQYLTREEADRLALRLRRLGYNAVRLHHYESELVDRSGGTSTKPDAQKLDQLDYLFAALKRQGVYITTDLYVSRPVLRSEIWPGESGDVGMDEYKMTVPVNDRAFANFKEFTRMLLTHRNPHTQMTWAEDPALAWLSLINEGNPGNFLHLLQGRLEEDYRRAWVRWHQSRYPGEPVPHMPLKSEESQNWRRFNVFLAENQRDFYERTRAFLRDELGCKALLTNMNAWTNPLQIQAVRAAFDYVDDHFYVDHPEFLEQPWRLPSRCPNTSPVAQGAPGGRPAAFHRMLDRPMALSEFNYSGPGRFRGVGGILTGALGAVQDWGVIWRFAYTHSRESVSSIRPAGYFDLATDPLGLASDRASICLFRRGDMRPAPHSIGITVTPEETLKDPATARPFVPGWHGLALVTRVGAQNRPESDLNLSLAAGEPYAPNTGERLIATMREKGWLSSDNATDLKANRFQSETGELTVDAPEDVLTLDTPRTAGGYAPAGKTIQTRSANVLIQDSDATVWVSSVDGVPIRQSRRLLITHLTDLQNSGARYGDRARRVLLDWGRLPHLVRAGRAEVSLRVSEPRKAEVWGLSLSGRRLERIRTFVRNGALVIPLDVRAGGKARMLYEVAVLAG